MDVENFRSSSYTDCTTMHVGIGHVLSIDQSDLKPPAGITWPRAPYHLVAWQAISCVFTSSSRVSYA
jgi:hypothetical protein